jgi:hypothetical protein
MDDPQHRPHVLDPHQPALGPTRLHPPRLDDCRPLDLLGWTLPLLITEILLERETGSPLVA